MTVENINKTIETLSDKGEISDGYHTFNELYEHRYVLFIALCKEVLRAERKSVSEGALQYGTRVYKAQRNADGTKWDGWFLLVLYTMSSQEQISYHLPIKYWNEVDCIEFDINPKFDGHTSKDVLERLKAL